MSVTEHAKDLTVVVSCEWNFVRRKVEQDTAFYTVLLFDSLNLLFSEI